MDKVQYINPVARISKYLEPPPRKQPLGKYEDQKEQRARDSERGIIIDFYV